MDNEQIKRLLESSLLKADHEFSAPPTILRISGEFGNQIFGTLGNFSLIIAPPKVGKTTFASILVSALIKNEDILNFIPELPEAQKDIIWIDTEQGTPECVRTIRSTAKMTTNDERQQSPHFEFYSFRQHNYATNMVLTESLIEKSRNLGLLIIDGIRDYVSSINDEKEASLIAHKLLKWSETKNIHILVILHQNKGDTNARGHLGTELINKAETVARLTRDESNGQRITIVEPSLTRHKEFEPFSYTLNESGLPELLSINKGYQPKSPKASELTFDEITVIIKQIFPNGESYKFSALQNKLHQVCHGSGKMFESFGMNKCSDLIKRLNIERYIIQKDGSTDYIFNKYPV